MITCKRATELISKSMEEPLSLKEEFSLRLHLFICEFCEKFAQQIKLLRSALNGKERDGSLLEQQSAGSTAPNPEAKARVKQKLREQSSFED